LPKVAGESAAHPRKLQGHLEEKNAKKHGKGEIKEIAEASKQSNADAIGLKDSLHSEGSGGEMLKGNQNNQVAVSSEVSSRRAAEIGCRRKDVSEEGETCSGSETKCFARKYWTELKH